MRVTLFIDGKNFFAGWKDVTGGRDIDFRRMSQWVVGAAGGSHYMGAYYYTGVDATIPPTPAQEKLENFLSMLEMQPGFFVQRFQQRTRTQTCASCGHAHAFSQEKEVDTTMVADMLRLAATNAFDVAVLMSGDADLVAAVEGVRALGKKVLVASWGSSGLSARIRRAAFDHIDLSTGLAEFARGAHGMAAPAVSGTPAVAPATSSPSNVGHPPAPAAPLSNDPAAYDALCLEEIGKAQAAMPGGYVGAHFFVTRWRSGKLPEIPDVRRRSLDRLVEQKKAEVYLTEDGIQAVRLKE
jgi:uncharacterized LabA/DUF88 family protein